MSNWVIVAIAFFGCITVAVIADAWKSTRRPPQVGQTEICRTCTCRDETGDGT